MDRNISNLIDRIRSLEEELETELSKKRDELKFSMENRRIRFEKEIIEEHRRLKTSLLSYIAEAELKHILIAPVVYSLILPFLILDLFVTFYQLICFPVYGIPKVKRREYIVFDRHHLAYLNLIEKLNCAYCSYGNGLVAYVREIAGRTEQYWCPIKHASRVLGSHSRYRRFLDFGDAQGYKGALEKLRKDFWEGGVMATEQGFLSSAIAGWTEEAKEKHKNWFDLADEVNRASMAVNDLVIPDPRNSRQLLGKLLYLRTLQTFQGAILLAERGMIAEAGTLVRSCAESAIALGGAAHIDDFPEQLLSAHDKHRKALGAYLESDRDTAELLTEDQKRVVSQAKSSLEGEKPQRMNWQDISERSGTGLVYNMVYRPLFGDSAHVTMLALDRHLEEGGAKIVFGPTDRDLPDTLSKAICVLLQALLKLHEIFPESGIDSRLQPLINKWDVLVGPGR